MYIAQIGTGNGLPAVSAAGPEQTDGPSMAEALAAAAAAADPQGMRPEEYLSYIRGKISALPIDPSQSMCSISVHITDAGLEAMQSDPEYEAWVLNSLACDFSFNDVWGPLCGGTYSVHTFGATKEEYHGESWFPGFAGGQGASLYETKSAGAAWQRNTVKRPSSSSSDKYGELAARLRLQRMLQKMALDRRDFQSELLASASQHRALVEAQHRTGQIKGMPAAPLPQLKGVSAAYLLAMLGAGL